MRSVCLAKSVIPPTISAVYHLYLHASYTVCQVLWKIFKSGVGVPCSTECLEQYISRPWAKLTDIFWYICKIHDKSSRTFHLELFFGISWLSSLNDTFVGHYICMNALQIFYRFSKKFAINLVIKPSCYHTGQIKAQLNSKNVFTKKPKR